MLTRVDVLSEEPFYLKIRDAKPTDSIIVEKIEGLTPPAVDLFLGEYARDGGFYNGRRVPARNPVITLTLNPNFSRGESMDGLREMVYRAFLDPLPNSDEITLLLHDDTLPLRTLSGHTEKIEGDPWSLDTTLQISMLCPNPFIQGLENIVSGVGGPLIVLEYPGSAESGFIADITFTTSSDYLYLQVDNRPPMILKYNFQFGDKVVVNSIPGQLDIRLIRRGVESAILYASTSDSRWQFLRGRTNSIRVYGQPTESGSKPTVATLHSVRYRAAYWGI